MKVIGVAVLLLCYNQYKAQQYFADYLILGSSLTYIPQVNRDANLNYNGYNELTWNINLSMRFSKRFVTGIQMLNIYSSEVHKKKDYYNIYGVFTQFNFFRKRETHRLFAEASINRGNYNVCGELPVYQDKIYYAGIGGGFDLPFKRIPNLYLDLSFISYLNLHSFPNNCAYTQYVAGLNYRINRKR